MSPSCASLTRLNSLLHWIYFKGAEDWGVEEHLRKHPTGQGAHTFYSCTNVAQMCTLRNSCSPMYCYVM